MFECVATEGLSLRYLEEAVQGDEPLFEMLYPALLLGAVGPLAVDKN